MTDPRAAVIIPVWNGRADLPRCLDALLAQDYPDFQVIAVDNASDDGSADLITANYPDVTLLRNPTNRGFAAACNAGLHHAFTAERAADVAILLNQDTEVQLGWLANLVAPLTADPQVGMTGSKALYPNGTIQHAGADLDPQVGGLHRGVGEPDAGQWDQPGDADFLSGVSLAISRSAYDTVGGLDEGFSPAYFEDVDWCYRVRAAGFRLLYAPGSVLIHHERSIQADGSYASNYSYQRNRLRLLLKHWPLERLLSEFAPAEKSWLQRQFSAEFVAGIQRAYIHHLLHLDELLRWRRDFLGEPLSNGDALVAMLMDLRTVYSMDAVIPPADGRLQADGRPTMPPHLELLLVKARTRVRIEPQPFHSGIPVLGPLIAWFRSAWNQVATKWFVLPLVEQQNAYNQVLLQALEQAVQDRDRLVATLIEYNRESGRELGELAEEVRQLRARLAAGEADSDQDADDEPGER